MDITNRLYTKLILRNVSWSFHGIVCCSLVRLTPKSSRDEIGGIERLADGRAVLKVRVRAVRQNGEANVARIRLLAKALR